MLQPFVVPPQVLHPARRAGDALVDRTRARSCMRRCPAAVTRRARPTLLARAIAAFRRQLRAVLPCGRQALPALSAKGAALFSGCMMPMYSSHHRLCIKAIFSFVFLLYVRARESQGFSAPICKILPPARPFYAVFAAEARRTLQLFYAKLRSSMAYAFSMARAQHACVSGTCASLPPQSTATNPISAPASAWRA